MYLERAITPAILLANVVSSLMQTTSV